MTIKEMREKLGNLAKQIRALADKCNDDAQEWSAEDEQTWTRTNEAYDKVAADLEAAEERQGRLDRAALVERENHANDSLGMENRAGNDGASLVCTDEHRPTVGW